MKEFGAKNLNMIVFFVLFFADLSFGKSIAYQEFDGDYTYVICSDCVVQNKYSLKPEEFKPVNKKERKAVPVVPLVVTYKGNDSQKEKKDERKDNEVVHLIKETVYFKLGEYTVSNSNLEDLRVSILPYINSGLIVEGYTCDTGSEDINLKLSKKRAVTVANFLSLQGFNIVKVEGLGSTREDKIQSKNRKVIVKLVDSVR